MFRKLGRARAEHEVKPARQSSWATAGKWMFILAWPLGFLGSSGLATKWIQQSGAPSAFMFVAPVAVLGLMWAGVTIWWRASQGLLDRAQSAGYRLCTKCHYPLAGLGDSCECPECGEAFSLPNSERAWEALRRKSPVWPWRR